MQQTRLQCGSIYNCQRERRKHHYKPETLTARDCLALHLMSPMRRGRGGWCWLLWWLKSCNGLANKLQNVMFSKTRTNGMYSNSAAWARSTRVQSPKREEILRWNTYSSFAHLYIYFFKSMWQCDTCDKHLPKHLPFVMRYSWEISAYCCQQTSNEVFLVPAYFRQNKSFINIHKC